MEENSVASSGNRTPDLPACSVVSQPTILLRARCIKILCHKLSTPIMFEKLTKYGIYLKIHKKYFNAFIPYITEMLKCTSFFMKCINFEAVWRFFPPMWREALL
jgi:hypothetical protein